MFAANAQQAADLNIIAHRIAELALTPGAIAQDGLFDDSPYRIPSGPGTRVD